MVFLSRFAKTHPSGSWFVAFGVEDAAVLGDC